MNPSPGQTVPAGRGGCGVDVTVVVDGVVVPVADVVVV